MFMFVNNAISKTCVTSNSRCTVNVCCIVVVDAIYVPSANVENFLTIPTISFEISGIQAFGNDYFNADQKIPKAAFCGRPQLRVYQSKRPIHFFLSNSLEFLIKLFDKK